MKSQFLSITAIVTTLITGMTTSVKPVQASFGDFMLGVGAAVGVGAIVQSNQRAAQERYGPATPQEEYFRGRQDGFNGLRYDNPRNSRDYDRGFQEGLRLRQQQR
ncbi:hypothetical protein [Geminocystis sp. NIES-3709]|uniref:hypothetical protein n=1 Tax=Geminocystis sp. NIES-3709 TaxID=1617448 RepID=UPI0005FCDA7B|nr:hypothetical protein [Geminocystis sp. NIES-3709]BAQ65468.1 hypothetical protein GM3709_2233 [Geminocystis sp. NIES-3709]